MVVRDVFVLATDLAQVLLNNVNFRENLPPCRSWVRIPPWWFRWEGFSICIPLCSAGPPRIQTHPGTPHPRTDPRSSAPTALTRLERRWGSLSRFAGLSFFVDGLVIVPSVRAWLCNRKRSLASAVRKVRLGNLCFLCSIQSSALPCPVPALWVQDSGHPPLFRFLGASRPRHGHFSWCWH